MDPQSFVGRREVLHDLVDPARIARLAATLDHASPPWTPGIAPPLAHWLCFLPDAPQGAIGPDGHPRRTDTGLLPNVDFPRRMWAGSRIEFRSDVPIGASITRTSTLVAATPKTGQSGAMLFVTVRHEIAVDGASAPAIVEDQDIVYREAPPPGLSQARRAADPGETDPVMRTLVPDAVLLFRYSALTFNGHRIHYDRDYARNEEGYPGLVVQGPLLATLLIDHLLRQEPASRIVRYGFRAQSPLFDGEPLTLGLKRNGNHVALRAIGPAGIAMTAEAEIAG
ncbi:MaoC family dehydratase N-terminal domain-containing protein [Rhizorhabdus wittichii]|uniref:MaoC family dehydratase N-terminal domain-containing protein n=1 Tax=Rhizorhabdus wittichii TaxID=160791 RepID=A0A975D1Y2_9SPHN|nr:MaoC family dehydratase N-terminal domain-containing protein [Rhizorhabdus wittichii]QTH21124.1 MaoC family dehydratase N-terminal domain-containing protein [Rhizorhabdus wittichii]